LLGSGNFTIQNGATVDWSSYTAVMVAGTLLFSSGTLTAPNLTPLNVGKFDFTGTGIFNHNNGTINIIGSTSSTLFCNSSPLNLVTFSATVLKTISASCTIPLGADPVIPNSLTINGSITGSGNLTFSSSSTITYNATASISGFNKITQTSGGSVAINGATLDFSGYDEVRLNGLTMSSGDLTAPETLLSIGGGMTFSGGTFHHNGGTVEFRGSSSSTISCNNVDFNLVTFVGSGVRPVSADCSLPLGNNPVVATGTGGINLYGTITGSGLLTISGGSTVNAGAQIVGFSGYHQNSNILTLNGMDWDASDLSPFYVGGYFIQNSGTFTAPQLLEVASKFELNGGTFNHNNGTVQLNRNGGAASTIAITCTGNPFHLVSFSQFNNSNTTYQLNSGCTLPLGDNPQMGVADSGVSFIINGTLQATGKLSVAGNLTLNSVNPLFGTNQLLVEGELDMGTGSTLNLSDYQSVQVGRMAIDGGNLVAPSGTMTVMNTWRHTAGTFSHNNGTVVLSGAGADSGIISNSIGTTFYNLTHQLIDDSTYTDFRITTQAPQVVEGVFTFTGTPSKVLNIYSQSPGVQASVDLRGPRRVAYTSIKDIAQTNATEVAADDHNIDAGNNSGFVFSATPVVFDAVSIAPTTSTTRPTFTWKQATSRSLAPVVSYSLSVENAAGTVFAINNIPPVASQETPTYSLSLDNFNDANPDNNYFSLTTKSSSSWDPSYNDGALALGPQIWSVTAYDSLGNSQTVSQNIVVLASTITTSPAISRVTDSPPPSTSDAPYPPQVPHDGEKVTEPINTPAKISETEISGDRGILVWIIVVTGSLVSLGSVYLLWSHFKRR